jgi:hypothetical protein
MKKIVDQFKTPKKFYAAEHSLSHCCTPPPPSVTTAAAPLKAKRRTGPAFSRRGDISVSAERNNQLPADIYVGGCKCC